MTTDNETWKFGMSNIDMLYLTDGLMLAGIAGMAATTNPYIVMGCVLIASGIINLFTRRKFKVIRIE